MLVPLSGDTSLLQTLQLLTGTSRLIRKLPANLASIPVAGGALEKADRDGEERAGSFLRSVFG